MPDITAKPMLSRVADNLYWMSRYLERAEHTARVLAVGLMQTIDQNPRQAHPRWTRLLEAIGASSLADEEADASRITASLTFDAENPHSIVSCIASARANARQVREQISSEMWEQLNRVYLRVRASSAAQIWQGEPIEFYQRLKEGAHLFQGITDATMSHGEGWFFIQVGRYLERAGATAKLLDTHFQVYFAPEAEGIALLEFNDWVTLLKSCTAFEAYCKVYTADVQPPSVAEFLLLDSESPRSVRFAADRIERGLQAISRSTGSRWAGRAERLAGRLRASLDYGQVDEIMAEDMHAYLDAIRRQCGAIHAAIYQAYITYSVESAIVQ
ncbi:alpha-E domain-containing protein [Candidatus Chloroploca sp. Khr17]|uniref:alpha-E domain-containing protein n=1 Tax=Candidatus Chloroploca sp. Khr17 TaxID=2496869 RepID=UPI001F0F2B5F|nr:alpha-E domain-containing protein [Candidatus Chloroploca sp. Khr17]